MGEKEYKDNAKKFHGYVASVHVDYANDLRVLHDGFCEGTNSGDVDISELSRKTNSNFFLLQFSLEQDGILSLEPVFVPPGEVLYVCVLEAFSFIKDLFHKHKFHSDKDDTIVKPIFVDSTDVNLDWVTHIQRDLHRSVIASFRKNTKESQVSALGKLTYLKAFTNLVRTKYCSGCTSIDIESLQEAIKSNIERFDYDKRSTFNDIIFSAMAIIFPLVFASIQLFQLPCIQGINYTQETCTNGVHFSISPAFSYFSVFFVSNIENFFILLATTITVTWGITRYGKIKDYLSRSLNKVGLIPEILDTYLRLALEYKWRMAAILLAAMLLVIALAIHLIQMVLGL